MTAVTALFMIPTAMIFPALLRRANTPPASVTLRRESRLRRWLRKHDGRMGEVDDSRPGDERKLDYMHVLHNGECVTRVFPFGVSLHQQRSVYVLLALPTAITCSFQMSAALFTGLPRVEVSTPLCRGSSKRLEKNMRCNVRPIVDASCAESPPLSKPKQVFCGIRYHKHRVCITVSQIDFRWLYHVFAKLTSGFLSRAPCCTTCASSVDQLVVACSVLPRNCLKRTNSSSRQRGLPFTGALTQERMYVRIVRDGMERERFWNIQ